MRLFLIISLLIISQYTILAQNQAEVKSHLNDNGELQFELKLEDSPYQIIGNQNWIKSTNQFLSGEIIRINPKEFIYKGKSLIYMSKKPSTFQTEIFFTLNITNDENGTRIIMNDIHYKSLPEYGKQGSVGLYTDCQDWFANKKRYKKSGKMRALNQNLLNNSSNFAEELLLSCIY